ncbi:DUF3606 domain-containing protein [Pseudolysobacter antarcticus]|uniref:DUF3606 domain-containing protein n=2 Tax=Pseudolysobacter antarcticus TaxID=2511995 RepID=A0A411HJE0_9GAMM|nr:DUF3606 domain-containing protein [Pseudolysobacter antarcticus]
MSTIMEMAQTIREKEETSVITAERFSDTRIPRSQLVDIHDADQISHLCRTFGATRFELCRIMEKVGNDISIVRRELSRR